MFQNSRVLYDDMESMALANPMEHYITATASQESDEQLVRLALADDRHFEQLVDRYETKLKRYIMRFINCSTEDAEDIVQDVFINAYRNLNGFDTGLKFSSWIYRIAHNEAVNHMRRITVRKTVAMEDEKLDALAAEVDVERELHAKLDHAKLRAAVERLDAKYREVLVLRYFEGRNYDEIADILHKPSGSVSSLITRAKRLLLKDVERENHPST